MKEKIIVILLLFLVLTPGCGMDSKVAVGDKAPVFTIKRINGPDGVFAPDENRNTILYFWADWCSRCDEDFRQVDLFFKEASTLPARPRLMAINVGQSREHVQNMINRLKPSFPIYLDPDGVVARQYGVESLPTYFFVDQHGTIRNLLLSWAHLDVLKELTALHLQGSD